MRKKTVKSIALGLTAVTLAATVLSGCGTSKDSAESGKNGGEEEVTLTFPVWDLATNGYLKNIVDGFQKEHPNIKINMVDTAGSEYMNKLTIMLNGGTDCDIVYVKDPDTTASYMKKGQLEDLTSYIEKDGIDTSKYISYDSFNLEGKQAALPFKTDYYVLFYNKDIFDDAGVQYPSNDMTWTEWEEMCSKLTSGEGANKIYGGFLHTWQACVQNWAIQDGKNTILGPDYTFMKPYYEMALRMQDAGTIMDYSTLKTGNIAYASVFQQGTVATVPMGTWLVQQMIAKKAAGETDVNWGIATIPHPDGVEAGSTVGSTTPMAINANSKYKEEAWEFIKYACGEKGSSYLISAGGFPSYQDDTTIGEICKADGMPEGAAEALQTTSIVLDRPININSAEVNQMLGEEHSLIMIKEKSIDDGLKEMGERAKEIENS